MSSQHQSEAPTTSTAPVSSADKTETSNTVTAPSSVIVQAKVHQEPDSAIAGSEQARGECIPEPELVQTGESEPPAAAKSPSNKSHCSSPDDIETEPNIVRSHTEDEEEETDTCSSPSSAEDTGIHVVKKQKIS